MQINKKISKYNQNPGMVSRIKFIVIHYCGSLGDAEQQATYFAGGNRNASAHYFVGYKGDVWQSVDDSNIAWHCGSKKYQHPTCRNANSIGIEMCCKTTGSLAKADENWYFEDATVKSTIELTKELMNKYKIPVNNVLRHYDVTGKICPAPYVFNTGKHTWDNFKRSLSGKPIVEKEVTKKKAAPKPIDNSKEVWDFLTNDCKLNNYAAAGIMGNLYAESGLNPMNLQNSYNKKFNVTDEAYTKNVDSGLYTKDQFIKDKAGYGIAQWTYWSRKNGLYEFAEKKGTSIGDLKMQLEYFWKEFSSNYATVRTKVERANSVREASTYILREYEKPADQSEVVAAKRADFGLTFYDMYAKE